MALSFSSLSFAFDSYNVFGVQLPIVKSEIENEASGGNIEKDFMSFYTSPKTANTATSLTAGLESEDDKDYIVVFGVQIPRNPGS